DLEQGEHSSTGGGNANLFIHFGNQYGDFSENWKSIFLKTQLYNSSLGYRVSGSWLAKQCQHSPQYLAAGFLLIRPFKIRVTSGAQRSWYEFSKKPLIRGLAQAQAARVSVLVYGYLLSIQSPYQGPRNLHNKVPRCPTPSNKMLNYQVKSHTDRPKEKRLISLCVGCGNQIHDQYILRVSPDLEWHAACLKCAECNQYLDESCTCFVRDGKTYCKRDYIRLYGIKCAKCSIGFSKNDFVMRARSKVYHIECFRCVACSRQLIPGDEFALREDGLFCRADHDVVERASLGAGDPLSPLHPARPLQMAAEPISARQPALRPHVHKQPEKTTRVRTVLNEKQLHTLRTCYAANPRPDALMKEQLVEMTGLSPRVIRVWFQNKRCKDKKRSIMMKQLQQQQPNDKTIPQKEIEEC
ncbi:hypothetical protein STEG23_028604, partial [Scotinomys teguina]